MRATVRARTFRVRFFLPWAALLFPVTSAAAVLPPPGQVDLDLEAGRRWTVGSRPVEIVLHLRTRVDDHLHLDRATLQVTGGRLVALEEGNAEGIEDGTKVREALLRLSVLPEQYGANELRIAGLKAATAADPGDREIAIPAVQVFRFPPGTFSAAIGLILLAGLLWAARRRRRPDPRLRP